MTIEITNNNPQNIYMSDLAQNLVNMIQTRLNSRTAHLKALQVRPIDEVPEIIQKMREQEAAMVRVVMQEQIDIMEIIKMHVPAVIIQKQLPG